jgi:hypothetical protein
MCRARGGFGRVGACAGGGSHRPAALAADAALGGLLLTGLVSVVIVLAFVAPLASFCPAFAVPGIIVFNIALLVFGVVSRTAGRGH